VEPPAPSLHNTDANPLHAIDHGAHGHARRRLRDRARLHRDASPRHRAAECGADASERDGELGRRVPNATDGTFRRTYFNLTQLRERVTGTVHSTQFFYTATLVFAHGPGIEC